MRKIDLSIPPTLAQLCMRSVHHRGRTVLVAVRRVFKCGSPVFRAFGRGRCNIRVSRKVNLLQINFFFFWFLHLLRYSAYFSVLPGPLSYFQEILDPHRGRDLKAPPPLCCQVCKISWSKILSSDMVQKFA